MIQIFLSGSAGEANWRSIGYLNTVRLLPGAVAASRAARSETTCPVVELSMSNIQPSSLLALYQRRFGMRAGDGQPLSREQFEHLLEGGALEQSEHTVALRLHALTDSQGALVTMDLFGWKPGRARAVCDENGRLEAVLVRGVAIEDPKAPLRDELLGASGRLCGAADINSLWKTLRREPT